MSDPSATINNEASNAKQRHWAAWVLDIFVAIGVLSQIGVGILLLYELEEFKASNELTRQSLELSRKNFDLTAKSVELAQRSAELSQTPWIDVSIADVTYKRRSGPDPAGDLPPAYGVLGTIDSKGRVSNNVIEISYELQNHSDSSAPRVYAEFFLPNATDRNLSSEDARAMMPHQIMSLRANLLVGRGDPEDIVNQINRGKLAIKAYILFFSATGKKKSAIETFYKLNNKFVPTNMEFDPPEARITDLIHESVGLDPTPTPHK